MFERDRSGAWTEVAILRASDGAPNDSFGLSVAISGTTVVAGAYQDDDLGSSSGSVYVFERGESGLWNESAKLVASDGGLNSEFGVSVRIDGDRLISGAWGQDESKGAAYVFEREGGGGWLEVAKITASDGEAFDGMGLSVDLDTDVAVLGGGYADGTRGLVYIFEQTMEGEWTEVAKFSGVPNAYFGSSLAIGGFVVAVGHSGIPRPMRVFERSSDGVWGQIAEISPSDGLPPSFGLSVASTVDTMLIGARSDDDNGSGSGSVYVYDLRLLE